MHCGQPVREQHIVGMSDNHQRCRSLSGGIEATLASCALQPAPVPPRRDLVALPPPPKVSLHAEGRFTVLSYNILADLYATVSVYLLRARARGVYSLGR